MEAWIGVGIFLLIAGFVLIGTEMLLPGFGLPGVSGIICMALGIVFTADSIEQGLTITIVVAVLLAIMFTGFLVLFHRKKMRSPIVLEEELLAEKGYISTSDLEYLIGKEGMALTDLRPSGKCNIDGVEFDVRSSGSFIQKGSKVTISSISGNTLIVRKL